ncbi:hypothetical protein B0T26DRAFT_876163 [Lasiosphaeria miniovina]|uniref:Uncharacterized protein n=1 Tax=Lasiosphaeria miniovina TaxID=1954250 RepID=A0AA39ZST4_9PEZI|nr:uncharacterized protein B0T26DRAFT_876163 [Lasiosphaeria miniovina]KAK0702972.1 hypothetical protein B0T26DRAFT_876163 [Lasiosphaeria miniovina]
MACNYGGNPDMYGLGVRMGFYLQWFGIVIAAWMAKSEVPGLRLVHSFFVSAAFLALILQASWNTIRPIDTYIMLLLTYGSYYCYLPVYLWRLVTVWNPFWDPSRWPVVPTTSLFRALNLVLLLAATSFQIWFWSTGINTLPRDPTCDEYGFFFTKVPLHAGLFVAVNLVFVIGLLISATLSLALSIGCFIPPRWIRKRERKFDRQLDRLEGQDEDYPWRRELQFLQNASNLTVLSVVVVAIGLTIQWNNLNGVSDLSTTSQLIPLIVAGGQLLHVLYVWFNPRHDREITRVIGPPRRGGSKRSSTTGGTPPDPWRFRRPAVGIVRPERSFRPPGRAANTSSSPSSSSNSAQPAAP